ncbi:MAG: DUF58 domain-containing protein [Acidimicrobiia bacterium]|nr:DUF58 domain-containing protein [Acidimicrobiia bacterium]
MLRRLELAITRRLDGLLQGEYRGLLPGHGSEPGETRGYQAGDDVRRIDWNVTARLDLPHVRETVADRELETWALVDLSPSLDFGTATCTKRDLALVALASVGFLTARTGNRFGVILSDGHDFEVLPARSGRGHLMATLHRVANRPPSPQGRGATTGLGPALQRLAQAHRRRGLAVVISDFVGPRDWREHAARLAVRHDVIAVEVLDPRELELPDVGVLAIVDPESGRRREVATSSPKLRARYAEASARQREETAAELRGAGVDHLVLRTDEDWFGALLRFVELRRKRAARLPRARR